MEWERCGCRACGADLTDRGMKLICRSCGAVYRKTEETAKLTEELSRLLSESQRARVRNLREQLRERAHAQYVNSEAILQLCRELRAELPNDFLARFYEAANGQSETELIDFLNRVESAEAEGLLGEVVDFTLRSLSPKMILPLKDLVERVCKSTDLELYSEYVTRIEEEAERVEEGIYEAGLSRDVFVAYSSQDMAEVKRLVSHLEENGLRCFVSARNLQHGRRAVEFYERRLEMAMDACRLFLFVSSEHSRSTGCDAVRHEIPYVRERDLRNAPPEYRNDYARIPAQYKKPRVEYRISDLCGNDLAERQVKQFFSGMEYCKTPEETAERIWEYLCRREVKEEPRAERAEEKICERCGTANKSTAHFCAECGHCFDEERKSKAAFAQEPEEDADDEPIFYDPFEEEAKQESPKNEGETAKDEGGVPEGLQKAFDSVDGFFDTVMASLERFGKKPQEEPQEERRASDAGDSRRKKELREQLKAAEKKNGLYWVLLVICLVVAWPVSIVMGLLISGNDKKIKELKKQIEALEREP